MRLALLQRWLVTMGCRIPRQMSGGFLYFCFPFTTYYVDPGGPRCLSRLTASHEELCLIALRMIYRLSVGHWFSYGVQWCWQFPCFRNWGQDIEVTTLIHRNLRPRHCSNNTNFGQLARWRRLRRLQSGIDDRAMWNMSPISDRLEVYHTH